MKNVLVIGLGKFGRHVVYKLADLKCEVMAIDLNEEKVRKVLPYVVSAQIGDTKNEEYVDTLGVSDFDLVYVCIGNFQDSLETTSLVKEKGAKFVVALCESSVQGKFLLKNGADEIIFPEKLIGEWGAIRYGLNNILDFIQIDESTGIYELAVPEKWVGKTVVDINVRKNHNINVIGYKQGSKTLQNIGPNTILEKDMTIMCIGEIQDIQKCFKV